MKKLLANDSFPIAAYRMLHITGTSIQSAVLLLLRLSWGFQIAESGYSHLTDVSTMVARFIKWRIPMPQFNVYISGYTELVGGMLLMLGLGTRLISVPLIFNFIVAFIAASRMDIADAFKNKGVQAGWDQIVNDAAFQPLALALIMLAFGAGSLSIDSLFARKMFCKQDK